MPPPPARRPFLGRARFPIAFASAAILAGTAVTAGWSPRFTGPDSVLVYTLIFASAASLESYLGVIASRRKDQFRDALFSLDVLIASAQMALSGQTTDLPSLEGSALPTLARRVREALSRSAEDRTSVWLQLDSGAYFRLAIPGAMPADSPQLEVLEAMVRIRKALQAAAPQAWERAAGPVAACVLFTGLAGALVPYSIGAAEWAPVLNAGVILFLIFGSVPLAFWAATSITIAPKLRAPETQPLPREPVWVLDLKKGSLYAAGAPEAQLASDELHL